MQAIQPLVARLRGSRLDVEDFLSRFDLTAAQVDDPDARIPLSLLDPLWQRASEVTGDPDFGLHAAESVTSGSFGLLSYLGVTSPTWRGGLERVCKYFRIFSDASDYQVETDPRSVRIIARHDLDSPGPVRQRVEFTIAVIHCYARACIAGEWALEDVFLEHPAPVDCSEHRRLFGRTPRFGAPRSGLAFAASLLDRPLRTTEPGLHRLLERQASQALATASSAPTLTAAVRGLLLRRGAVTDRSLDEVAHQLHMSARTLQRRLRDEGTTLARLVAGTRRTIAAELLARRDVPISEVAFALGFSETAAFHHAFKRWTGVTPAAYRRAACPRGGDPAGSMRRPV